MTFGMHGCYQIKIIINAPANYEKSNSIKRNLCIYYTAAEAIIASLDSVPNCIKDYLLSIYTKSTEAVSPARNLPLAQPILTKHME